MRNKKFVAILIPPVLLFALLVLYISQKQLSKETCGCPAITDDGQIDQQANQVIFNNQPLATNPQQDISFLTALDYSLPVLGVTSDDKWIEVDLSDQRLYAHEGDRVVFNYLISSGKWAPTPTGEYRIWYKIKYTKMEGGRKENHTYYYLPNVPYVQYFYQGYGIHGAYWHNNFGNPMSHGCINMRPDEAKEIFYWTDPSLPEGKSIIRPSTINPGTRVIIHQ